MQTENKDKKIRSLTSQVISLLVFTLVPAVILSILLSFLLVNESRKELLTANNNEVRLYMRTIDGRRQAFEDRINSLISEYWDVFAGNSDSSKFDSYQMYLELRSLREQYNDIICCSFLITEEEGENVMLSFDNTKIDYPMSGKIKSEIMAMDLSSLPGRHYLPIRIEEDTFLLYCAVNYQKTFAVGALMLTDDLLLPLMENGNLSTDYLQCSGGETFGLGEHRQDLSGLEGFEDGIQALHYRSVIRIVSECGDFALIRVMESGVFFRTIPMLLRALVAVSMLMILIIPLTWVLLQRSVLKPLERLRFAMREVEQDNLSYRMEEETSSRDLHYVQQEFNSMAGEIQNLRIQTYEREIEKLQVEADNIRLQVSPHMLMNSLNMIYNLALSKNYNVIRQFTLCLSDYFRYSLKSHEELVPLSEELRFLESYLGVQKVRFPGKFVYVYDIEEETMAVRIPPLLIQNFVENTIKYGLKMDSEIEIILTVTADEDKIRISIVDTGTGMSEETLAHLRSGEIYEDINGTHYGIWNCRRRLHLLYGDSAGLNMTSEPGEGTQIFIELPGQAQKIVGGGN